jgi:hypothetical protein
MVQLDTTRLGEVSQADGATHCELSAAQSAERRTQTSVAGLPTGMQPKPAGHSAPLEQVDTQ